MPESAVRLSERATEHWKIGFIVRIVYRISQLVLEHMFANDVEHVESSDEEVVGILRAKSSGCFFHKLPENISDEDKLRLLAYCKCDVTAFLFLEILQKLLEGKS
jgi:hypothetical protein